MQSKETNKEHKKTKKLNYIHIQEILLNIVMYVFGHLKGFIFVMKILLKKKKRV